jgi:hypothetical protein
VAEFMLRHGTEVWPNRTLVLLGVHDEFQLDQSLSKASGKELLLAEFREPDFGNELTAYCAWGPGARQHFRGYSTL